MSENKIDPMDLVKNQDMDAMKWAEAFNDTLVELGYQPHDLGWLVGWFANPIMVGYDLGGSRARKELLKERNEAVKEANDQCQDIFESRKMIGEQEKEITRLKKIISIAMPVMDITRQAIEGAVSYDPMIDNYKLKQYWDYKMKPARDHARAAKKEIEAMGQG